MSLRLFFGALNLSTAPAHTHSEHVLEAEVRSGTYNSTTISDAAVIKTITSDGRTNETTTTIISDAAVIAKITSDGRKNGDNTTLLREGRLGNTDAQTIEENTALKSIRRLENTDALMHDAITTQRSDATVVKMITCDERKSESNTPVYTADATVAYATCDDYCDKQPGTEPNIFVFDLLPVVSTVQPFKQDVEQPADATKWDDAQTKFINLLEKLNVRSKINLLFQQLSLYQR